MYTSTHDAITPDGDPALIEVVSDPDHHGLVLTIEVAGDPFNTRHSVQIGQAAARRMCNEFGILLGALRYAATIEPFEVDAVDHHDADLALIGYSIDGTRMMLGLVVYTAERASTSVRMHPDDFEGLRSALYAGVNYLDNHNAWRMP